MILLFSILETGFHYLAQSGFKFEGPPTSISQELGLQACTTPQGSNSCFEARKSSDHRKMEGLSLGTTSPTAISWWPPTGGTSSLRTSHLRDWAALWSSDFCFFKCLPISWVTELCQYPKWDRIRCRTAQLGRKFPILDGEIRRQPSSTSCSKSACVRGVHSVRKKGEM